MKALQETISKQQSDDTVDYLPKKNIYFRNPGAGETVATVGLWEQTPNIYNAIPRKVRLDIDIRDTSGERRDAVLQAAFDAAESIAGRRKCGLSHKTMFSYPPATSNEQVGAAAASTNVVLLYKHAIHVLLYEAIPSPLLC